MKTICEATSVDLVRCVGVCRANGEGTRRRMKIVNWIPLWYFIIQINNHATRIK